MTHFVKDLTSARLARRPLTQRLIGCFEPCVIGHVWTSWSHLANNEFLWTVHYNIPYSINESLFDPPHCAPARDQRIYTCTFNRLDGSL
jgi:hypothetical protein